MSSDDPTEQKWSIRLTPMNVVGGTARLGLYYQGKKYRINIDPANDKSEEPGWWYLQANSYKATFEHLASQPASSAGAFAIPAVYMLGISLELYMKTFLMNNGLSKGQVRAFGHNLARLRRECAGLQSQFDNEDLTFVADTLGTLIMDDGGMRYPQDTGGVAIYQPQMSNALSTLEEIVRPLVTTPV